MRVQVALKFIFASLSSSCSSCLFLFTFFSGEESDEEENEILNARIDTIIAVEVGKVGTGKKMSWREKDMEKDKINAALENEIKRTKKSRSFLVHHKNVSDTTVSVIGFSSFEPFHGPQRHVMSYIRSVAYVRKIIFMCMFSIMLIFGIEVSASFFSSVILFLTLLFLFPLFSSLLLSPLFTFQII